MSLLIKNILLFSILFNGVEILAKANSGSSKESADKKNVLQLSRKDGNKSRDKVKKDLQDRRSEIEGSRRGSK